LYAKPNYPSPNITFNTLHGKFMPNILIVGQSFSYVLLYALYNNPTPPPPIWNETYFSYYNSRVIHYPNSLDSPWGEEISDKTDDFELYLSMDVIMIEFIESNVSPSCIQFDFVDNMLRYLKSGIK